MSMPYGMAVHCPACDTEWVAGSSSEEEAVAAPPAEAKRAAVVKRGADREHRDLFASRPADLGSVKQTLHPPAPPHDAEIGSVAARNETSVLFTVDALKGVARVKTPEPAPTPMSSGFRADEDEGIIDLKALASSPPKGRPVAPLFSEPPPAAFTADVSDSFGRASSPNVGFRLGKRAMAGIAAAVVAVVLSTIGLAAAFRGEEPIARSANAAMAPIASPPPAVVAPAPPPAAAAPVTASTTDNSSDDDKSSKKGKTGKAGKGAAKASFSGTKVQSSGVAPKKSEPLVSKAPAAPKAADKCGCKGNFDCILRCTATGK